MEIRGLNQSFPSVDILKDAKKKNDVSKLSGIGELITKAACIDDRAKPDLIWLSNVEREEIHWLWYPYIPYGKLTMIEGNPGIGKTWLTLAICKMVTTGEGIYDNGKQAQPANVIFMSAEDGAGDTIKPRFEDMDGDCERFAFLNGTTDDKLITLDNIPMLETAIKEIDPKLVVIDPLQAYLGAKVDMYRTNEVRPIMAGLARLAEQYGIAILTVRHLTKASKSNPALQGNGSIDFSAAVRSQLLVGRDPKDPSRGAFIRTKGNLAKESPAQGFVIEENQWSKPVFKFTGECDLTAEDLIAAPMETTKTDDAEGFLKAQLEEAAKNAGFSFETLRRAKEKLGVKSVPIDMKSNHWEWQLPK